MVTVILFAWLISEPQLTEKQKSPQINGLKGTGSIDITATWTNFLDIKRCQKNTEIFHELDIRPAYSDLFKRRLGKGENKFPQGGINGHMKCPAFKDFLYNCYVLLFPYDLHLRLNPVSQSFSIIESSVDLDSEMILVRWGQQYADTRVVISLNPYILFDATEDVLMEVSPAFLHAVEPRLQCLTPVPGAFNIGRWFRPIDFTFELSMTNQDIELHKGDPLIYLRFKTPNNESIRISQHPFNAEYSRRALECSAIASSKSNSGNNARQLNEYYQALDLSKGQKLGG